MRLVPKHAQHNQVVRNDNTGTAINDNVGNETPFACLVCERGTLSLLGGGGGAIAATRHRQRRLQRFESVAVIPFGVA